jgi:disulfide bond formation protein DsbB
VSKPDVIDAVSLLLAGLAAVLQVLLAVVLVVAVVTLFRPGLRRTLVESAEALGGSLVWLAWGIAAAAMCGSLFFSEYADFTPCGLCWYQRIAMYPLVAILLVGALRRDLRGAAAYGLPLALIGAAISTWHIYIEINPEAETGFCTLGDTTSCAVKWIEELGYVTIPVLALTAFVSIAVLLAAARAASRPRAQ